METPANSLRGEAIVEPTVSPSTPPPVAGPPAAAGSVSPAGFFVGSVSLGLADGIIRVARGSDWLLLANPRLLASDEDEQLYGLGFILRRSPAEGSRQSLFLRLDMRHTPGDNWRTTTSGGYEHRTPVWTGRLRGFLSPHGADVIERRVVEETVRRRNGSIDTIRHTFERLEIPLSGAEAEAGVRVLLPRWLGDLGGFGGAHFRDGPNLDSQFGWLTRAEYRPRERFSFDFAAYFNRDFSETELVFGVRFISLFGPRGGRDSSGHDAYWFAPPPFNPRAISSKDASVGRSQADIIATKPPPRPRPPPAPPPPTPPPEDEL